MALGAKIYQEIVEQIIVGILLFDKTTKKCIYANSMAQTSLGLTNTDIDFSLLVPKEVRKEFRGLTWDLLSLEGVFEDIVVQKLDETVMIANLGITYPEDNIVLMTVQDMTFQKKLQREVVTKQTELNRAVGQLQQQNQELKVLDKTKDRFVALTSHELRTPISAIVATAQFIHDGLCTDPQEILKHVDVILDEGNHLLEMVNDILDFSKIQMGKLELYVEEHEIIKLVKHDVQSMLHYAEPKKIQIVFKEPSKNPKVFVDTVRLTQVTYNILSNAVKFSPEGSRVLVNIDTSNAAEFVKISIKDSGAGIPKDQAHKVFNEFETIENIRTHHKGTGLGMPISKRIMEAMGGKIYFESEPGKGTTFFVEIPTKKVLAAELYRHRSDSNDLLAAS